MTITSELIGKLGGEDIESTPINASLRGNGSSQVLHTVNIPAGETWLVAVVGIGTAGSSTGNNMPRINIGGAKVPQSTGHFASAEIMTESGDVILESNSSNTSSIEGHVYTVKM